MEETVARGILTGGTEEKIPKLDINNESSWELSQTFQTIGPDLLVAHEISFVDQELFLFSFSCSNRIKLNKMKIPQCVHHSQ